jgi:hypothetical protein
MPSDNQVSVLILAKNEAEIIEQAIASVGFAGHLVIGIDTATTDNTEEIIKRLADPRIKIIKIDVSRGFAFAKNSLIDASPTTWALILDADETVTTQLGEEITGILATDPQADAFNIDFDTYLLGRQMKHGGWAESHVRLLRTDRCRYTEKPVHEELQVPGKLGKLAGRIRHNTHRTIKQLVNKINLYSDYEAELYANRSGRIGAGRMFYEAGRHFMARYVVRAGWRDGTEGLIEAAMQSFSVFISWAKAWELQKKRRRT